MRGLLIKDTKLLLQQKRFFVLMFIIAIMLNVNGSGTFVISYLTFLCTTVGLSTISYDEFDNGYAFLFTLPVERRTYAREKYIFSIILGVLAWIVGVLVTIPVQMYQKADFVMTDSLVEAVALLPCLFIILSFMIPILLKFGGEKGRTVMLASIGIIFVAVFALVKLNEVLHVDWNKIFCMLPTMSIELILSVAFAAAIVIMAVSVVVSAKIMEKKEF